MKHWLPGKIQFHSMLGAGLIALSLVMGACTPAPAPTPTPPPATTAAPTSTPTPPPTSTTAPTPTTPSAVTTPVNTTTALTLTNGSTTKTYTLADLKALPVTTGSGIYRTKAGNMTGPNTFVGVSLTNLIKAAGEMTSSQWVKITATDGYSQTLPYAQVYQGYLYSLTDTTLSAVTAKAQPYILVAYQMDGKDLDASTGPVRTVVITADGQVSQGGLWVKWANKIEILSSATLNISAAASLTDALNAINSLYVQSNPNIAITPNFASSGTLQTQIQNGAPSDVFISAASAQMDNLQKGGLILDDTRKNLLNNKVVLIVPLDSALGLTGFRDLALDKVKKIAIGDPKSVPAGTYANLAFDQLGINAKVQPKAILGADVRQVLTYVEGGNVDAGIVYSTDALTSTKVKVVGSAPDDISAQVVYPAAVIKASQNQAAAKDFLNFLFSAQAKTVFEKYGFTMALK